MPTQNETDHPYIMRSCFDEAIGVTITLSGHIRPPLPSPGRPPGLGRYQTVLDERLLQELSRTGHSPDA